MENEYSGICFIRNTTICNDCLFSITTDENNLPLLSNLHQKDCTCIACIQCKDIREIIKKKIHTKLEFHIESMLLLHEMNLYNSFIYLEKRNFFSFFLQFISLNKKYSSVFNTYFKKLKIEDIKNDYYEHRMMYELLYENENKIKDVFFGTKFVFFHDLEEVLQLLFESLFLENDFSFIDTYRAERFFMKYAQFQESSSEGDCTKAFYSKLLNRFYN